jgi:hypothetical protein
MVLRAQERAYLETQVRRAARRFGPLNVTRLEHSCAPKRGYCSVRGHPKPDFERIDLASPTIATIHRPRKKPYRPCGRQGFSQVRGVALLLLAKSIERLGQTIGRNPNGGIAPCGVFPCETAISRLRLPALQYVILQHDVGETTSG